MKIEIEPTTLVIKTERDTSAYFWIGLFLTLGVALGTCIVGAVVTTAATICKFFNW
jgi:hypothetical protein